MAFREELERSGNFLFRWRSYIPLGLIVLVLACILTSPDRAESQDLWLEMTGFAVSLFGLFIRVMVIGYKARGTSGRNTQQQEASVLNTRGMYSMVRHPLYLGNFIIWFGLALMFGEWWMATIVGLIFWVYYERIIFAEEEFLRREFGQEFLDWAEGIPTFIPDFRKWKSPEVSFSWKKALGNEYHGFFAIISAFMVIEVLGDLIREHRFEIDILWAVIFGVGLVTYSVIRYLKRRTHVLDTPDR
ncbi:MAG: isoprenylcysteine carboxylmethyltransferase family protein [Pseudomonadota bacterium]